MRIGLTSLFVENLDKALPFYPGGLGVVSKADVSYGPFRRRTVASPEDPGGTELQRALDDMFKATGHQKEWQQRTGQS